MKLKSESIKHRAFVLSTQKIVYQQPMPKEDQNSSAVRLIEASAAKIELNWGSGIRLDRKINNSTSIEKATWMVSGFGDYAIWKKKKKKKEIKKITLWTHTLWSGILIGRTPEADIMALFDQCFHQVFSWPINRVTIVHKHLKEKWNLGTHFK